MALATIGESEPMTVALEDLDGNPPFTPKIAPMA